MIKVDKEMDKKQTVFDDLKECKGYILGIIGFATTVSVFMIQVFHFQLEPTLIGVCSVALCMLLIGFFINRSEKREQTALAMHKQESSERTKHLQDSLDEIKKLTLETRLDSIRTLLTMYINTQPENHDTILKIAQRYFIEYGGDWVMTDEFLKWADSETEAGRKVHIPSNLLNTVNIRKSEETKL